MLYNTVRAQILVVQEMNVHFSFLGLNVERSAWHVICSLPLQQGVTRRCGGISRPQPVT